MGGWEIQSDNLRKPSDSCQCKRCFMVVVKSSPTIIGVITFLVHTKLLDQKLSAATGFTALALFQQLRMPLIVLPDTINYYIQVRRPPAGICSVQPDGDCWLIRLMIGRIDWLIFFFNC